MQLLNLLLTLMTIVVWIAVFYPKTNLLTLRVLDIGQGDSLLLTLPEGQTILIDGGPDHTVIEKLGTYLPFWEHSLDVFVLTHPHEDHLSGALDVLNTYTVEGIISNPAKDEQTASWKAWNIKLATTKHMSIQEIASIHTEDHRVTLDLFSGSEVQKNQNNNSIVLGITFGEVRMTLMGDAEVELEKELLQTTSFFNSPITVLKTGHHGSQTSSSTAFLEVLHPQIGLISCGINNKFNHPYPETVERLKKLGTALYRTDLQGTIEVMTDGNIVEVATEKELPI